MSALHGGWCPECGKHWDAPTVACPECRDVLVDAPPVESGPPVVVHRVPDATAGALLAGLLENHDIPVRLRNATLPGYGDVRRDWGTSAWGELMVQPEHAEEARQLIAEYLAALERGGRVNDADVEGTSSD